MASNHRASAKRHPNTGMLASALSLVALSLALLAALVLIVVPFATGSQQFAVLTSSMKPHYAPGTLLVVKPVAFSALEPGDVVTYQLESGRPEVITHRIMSTGVNQEGNKVLVTQGDNNDVADPTPVTEIQVRGKLFYAVPFAGYLSNWLGNQNRGMATDIGAIALIGYGVVSIARAAIVRAKKAKGSTTEVPEFTPRMAGAR